MLSDHSVIIRRLYLKQLRIRMEHYLFVYVVVIGLEPVIFWCKAQYLNYYAIKFATLTLNKENMQTQIRNKGILGSNPGPFSTLILSQNCPKELDPIMTCRCYADVLSDT